MNDIHAEEPTGDFVICNKPASTLGSWIKVPSTSSKKGATDSVTGSQDGDDITSALTPVEQGVSVYSHVIPAAIGIGAACITSAMCIEENNTSIAWVIAAGCAAGAAAIVGYSHCQEYMAKNIATTLAYQDRGICR